MQGEVLYEMRFQLGVGVDMGTMLSGSRANFLFTGEVSGPSIHGKVDGVYFVLKQPDGEVSTHAHGLITTDSGDIIYMDAKGCVMKMTDERFAVNELVTYETTSKELTWLNSNSGVTDGFFDVNTSKLNAKVFKAADTLIDGDDLAGDIVLGLSWGWRPVVESEGIVLPARRGY